MEGIFPKITIARGDVVFEDNEIVAKRGRGRFIPGKGLITESDED